MVKMENTNFNELLTAYVQARYPVQKANQAVLTINLAEIEFECDLEALKEELDSCGILPPPQFLHAGILILEMNQGMAQHIVNTFTKSGFTMLIYHNGEIIHENM